jgi:hypothetical protein
MAGNPFSPQVNALAVFDDGSGSALYAVGPFISAGGVPAHGIAKWDGQNWSALTGLIGGHPFAMAGFDDGENNALYIAGEFQTVGGIGLTSPYITRWVGCPNCYANFDSSTVSPVINIADFTAFLRNFADRNPQADCNADAALTVADFPCFLQKFAAGCP